MEVMKTAEQTADTKRTAPAAEAAEAAEALGQLRRLPVRCINMVQRMLEDVPALERGLDCRESAVPGLSDLLVRLSSNLVHNPKWKLRKHLALAQQILDEADIRPYQSPQSRRPASAAMAAAAEAEAGARAGTRKGAEAEYLQAISLERQRLMQSISEFDARRFDLYRSRPGAGAEQSRDGVKEGVSADEEARARL